MAVIVRNNVRIEGDGDRAMVFAHGFGCEQNMWRFVEPAFRDRYRTVLFDHVGAGRSDLTAYDPGKYSDLNGYAAAVVEIGQKLELTDAVFVGHSVSAMIGALASIRAPGMFGKLVMVGPSPRYIDEDNYTGGFSAAQIEELIGIARRQSHGMVCRYGSGDYGKRRSSRVRGGIDQFVLPYRSGYSQAVCTRDLYG